jgi:hypothetical protein
MVRRQIVIDTLPAAAITHAHRSPGGLLLIVIVALALLYIAWRNGRLGNLRGTLRTLGLRRELQEHRISPFSLVPLGVLLIVVVVLVIAH